VTQVREGDRDRYLALLFSPATVRDDLAAIAAFNLELARAASDLSETMMGLVRLQWWREALEEIDAGGAVRQHPVAQSLAAATRAHNLPIDRMMAMVAAREEELEADSPPTQAAFDGRADATAANLIRLSLHVVGSNPAEPALAAACAEVGHAYATIGCARSVLIDARRRRVRLPAEQLAAAGVDFDKLFDLRPQPALAACLRGMAEMATSDLNAARRHPAPRRARPLTITGKLASLHLERLRRAAYDPFDPAVIAAPPFDVWRLLWTALAGRF
jgi:NADH dehydrogenase [ubiquinone] 1 alpha subcomplex assembly factor 6